MFRLENPLGTRDMFLMSGVSDIVLHLNLAQSIMDFSIRRYDR